MVLILLNTLFLASEFYDQPEWLTKMQEIGNFVFTIAFGIEMVYLLLVLGVIAYFSEASNIFDAIIVIISFVELFQPGEGSGISVLRAFRLMRIFRLVKTWKELLKLVLTVLDSLEAIANLGVLMILFLFMVALLMKQFYGA